MRNACRICDPEGIRTCKQQETLLAVMVTTAIILKTNLWQRTQSNESLGSRPTDRDFQKIPFAFSCSLYHNLPSSFISSWTRGSGAHLIYSFSFLVTLIPSNWFFLKDDLPLSQS
jgi:hypothetical protein